MSEMIVLIDGKPHHPEVCSYCDEVGCSYCDGTGTYHRPFEPYEVEQYEREQRDKWLRELIAEAKREEERIYTGHPAILHDGTLRWQRTYDWLNKFLSASDATQEDQ